VNAARLLPLCLALCAACGASTSTGAARADDDTGPLDEPTDYPGWIDAVVERELAMLDHDLAGVTPGPRLDEKVRIQLPPPEEDAAPADRPVVVHYFYELACKYCAQARDVLAELARRYPDAVAVVHRPVIVHRVPAMGAHLVQCAAAEAKVDLTAALWEGAYAARDFSSANLLAIARAAGLGTDLVEHMPGGPCGTRLRAATVLARRFGVRGTPTFVVNGLPLEGLATADELAVVIDAELARWATQQALGRTVAEFHAAWWSIAFAPR
jgi:protein-disulfide isomerase